MGVLLFFCLLYNGAYAASLRLALVLSEHGGAYLEFSETLTELLANSAITMQVVNVDQPLPDAELVIAAGMKAALAVARTKPAAMFAVLIPKEGYTKLQNELTGVGGKGGATLLSAIYLDQPLKRQLDLITTVLPHTRSIGILYSNPPKEISSLRSQMLARKLALVERSPTETITMHAALQSLLQNSDVVLALPDTEIYNSATIRNILLTTYRNKTPVIGFSPAYVKAGALCAVFSTPEQLSAQTLTIIMGYAESRTLPVAQHARGFEVSINEQVARSLGLTLKSESQVRLEMGGTP